MLSAYVLNVGQGDSILFQLPDRRAGLVDCNIASWRKRPPVAELMALYALKGIDVVALTHPHTDHYLGMEDFIKEYADEITSFWDSGLPAIREFARKREERNPRSRSSLSLAAVYRWFDTNKKQLAYSRFEAKRSLIETADLSLTCLSPDLKAVIGINNAITEYTSGISTSLPNFNEVSGVIAAFYGSTCLIFGADATSKCWDVIIETLKSLRLRRVKHTIVKVPHHGSRRDNPKTGWDYLKKNLSATHAVISVGKKNRFGHPHAETVGMLLDLGIKIVCTSGIEYEKHGEDIVSRDTWVTFHEKSGTHEEQGQNVEIMVPPKGAPMVKTRRFG
jgi:competence protein ComEC